MRYFQLIVCFSLAVFFSSPALSSDVYLGGIWTKTSHPDPHNISIFYIDNQDVKAIGYEQIAGKAALWYGEGSIQDGLVNLTYRYSADATPSGWEPEGSMRLKVSKEGDRMSGLARSLSGNWSDEIEYVRIYVGSLQAGNR